MAQGGLKGGVQGGASIGEEMLLQMAKLVATIDPLPMEQVPICIVGICDWERQGMVQVYCNGRKENGREGCVFHRCTHTHAGIITPI